MTATAPMEDTRLTVGRWLNSYVVRSGDFAGHALLRDAMDRIDRSIAEALPAHCEQWFLHAQRTAGPEVWRIRKLDLSFMVNVPAPGDVVRSWSSRLVDDILDITARHEQNDDVLCFPNRAAYLAQFVLDLVAGRARGKWYYEEFESLEQLGPGRAIVEAFTVEPSDGVATLLHLARSRNLDEILLVLSAGDARILCEACFGRLVAHQDSGLSITTTSAEFSGGAAELSQWSSRLLEVWGEEPLRTGLPSGDYHDVLRWIAQTASRYTGAERDPAAFAALNGLLALRRVLAAMRSPVLADRLVRDLADEKMSVEQAIAIAPGGRALSESPLRFLAQIARGDPDWASQAAAVLLRDMRPAAAASEGESLITSFCGVFLIAPLLGDLHLQEVAEAAAGESERCHETAAFFRYAVLAKSLGRAMALRAAADPAVRILSGCDHAILHQHQAFATSDLSRALALFARHLVEQTGCEGRCLAAETINTSEHQCEILLLRDVASNAWLYASACPQPLTDREQLLVAAIDFVHPLTGNAPHLLLRGSLTALAGSQALRERARNVVRQDNEEIGPGVAEMLYQTGCASSSEAPEKIARLLALSAPEFTYFSTASVSEHCDIALDLLTILICRAAFRGFARRLMGFQSASPEHIYRNFFEGIGTVRNGPAQIEIELPRTPLSLILRLSGLDRQTYTVPWLEGREICLLPPRD